MPHTTDIGFQLHYLSNLLKRRMEHSAVSLHMDDNVTRNNGWILNYLAHHSERDIYQKDIENDFGIRRSTVSKVIRLMEEKGLICREKTDSDTGREKTPGRHRKRTAKNGTASSPGCLRRRA